MVLLHFAVIILGLQPGMGIHYFSYIAIHLGEVFFQLFAAADVLAADKHLRYGGFAGYGAYSIFLPITGVQPKNTF